MYACGDLGLSIDYFYDLTPRQFSNIAKGIANKRELQDCISWEQSRLIAHHIYLSIPLKKGSKHVFDVKEYMPFPWEETKVKVNKATDSIKIAKDFFEKLDSDKNEC